ncbi:DUF2461 domain-containing protein [Pseudochryseolinea flava]|uniref:DUF2461 domain-containing protein n=1 Tax=Pseudochryseolinea flava TaxID=2059302 RepID=A0A364YC72_9BACT|nr:DUF2461 domain-containing protein [Pseudochryseolinea flava]RAW03328.1 DUF2461 domain-containing protein [Pseudochryseolinea flava]
MKAEAVFDFLKKLSRNNNREWFEKNKGKYLEIKEMFDAFAVELFEQIVMFDESIATQDPKKLTFRIYRDVRFSKDKTPYKTHMSAAYSSVGKGLGKPGYYIQIEPGNKSFIGIGQYMPDAENLSRIRQEIDYNGDNLKKAFKEKSFKKYYDAFWDGDALKTSPKGYPKDHPHAEWLKLKSFIITHEFSDADVLSKTFLKNIAAAAKAGKPLNDFLNEALA